MASSCSLDQAEKRLWNPGPGPLDVPAVPVVLTPLAHSPGEGARALDLSGEWEMAPDGYTADRLRDDIWDDAVPAQVPCTVHTALLEAEKIPDPLIGLNDKYARENSYRTWWLRRRFSGADAPENSRLVFEGVCYRASVWLNGVWLGQHSGMFGGPAYDVSRLIRDENVLTVKIENAPANPAALSEHVDNDTGWWTGTVINCVYGWHYACIPTRGIWAPVRLESGAAVELAPVFVATENADRGEIRICLGAVGESGGGTVRVRISPKNFEGGPVGFEVPFTIPGGESEWKGHFTATVPDHRLWWPGGHGEQALYLLEALLVPERGEARKYACSFGIRTIENLPLPGGEREDAYNWICAVNGKKIFLKGSNWCTTDALLRLSERRYGHFLRLAKEQHINLLRAWGGGIPETDTFYDFCDEYGILVMQEWPTCWDSHKRQPFDELMETVRVNTLRLRNRASLYQWAGGNESPCADGEAMEAMGRLACELDGTRAFHRTSPWGGSLHSYITYWEMRDVDESLKLRAPFIGEFGMASAPNLQSVMRYLPPEERDVWPPAEHGSFSYHTPRFNHRYGENNDMDHLGKRAAEFLPLDSMRNFVTATQLAQATVIRHTLEAARCRWPDAAGICYYKLTDVFPACSWAAVDYYGAPKLSYYFIKQAYAPVHACLLIESTTIDGDWRVPAYLLNETADGGLTCVFGAYDSALGKIAEKSFEAVSTAKEPAACLGHFP